MDQLALFLFDNAFSFADVDQSLNIVPVVLFFFLCRSLFDLLLLSQTIERSMPGLGGKGQKAIERAQSWQEPHQLAFRVTQRNQPRNELTKNSGQDQTQSQ